MVINMLIAELDKPFIAIVNSYSFGHSYLVIVRGQWTFMLEQ